MKKLKLDCGLTAYKATAKETELLGGAGICDDCGRFAPEGYLVPVLNHYQCPNCFAGFKATAKFYPEDKEIEKQYCEYYERQIPLDGSEKGVKHEI